MKGGWPEREQVGVEVDREAVTGGGGRMASRAVNLGR